MIDIEEIAVLDTQIGTMGSIGAGIGADAADEMLGAGLIDYLISVAIYTG